MNPMQFAKRNLLNRAKGRVHKLECDLIKARTAQMAAEAELQRAISADPESWHNTPGILK